MEYLELGPAPYDEQCVQIGTLDYREKAIAECQRYKEQIIRQFGEPPENAGLRVKGFPHDFGNYYELCINFDPDDEKAVEYAFEVEGNLPANWE